VCVCVVIYCISVEQLIGLPKTLISLCEKQNEVIHDLRFPQRYLWRMMCFGIWSRVEWYIVRKLWQSKINLHVQAAGPLQQSRMDSSSCSRLFKSPQ
jgi:hypothetical protein